MSFQIYRNTSVGESLMETIEQMAQEEKLTEEIALAVLKQFDTVCWGSGVAWVPGAGQSLAGA